MAWRCGKTSSKWVPELGLGARGACGRGRRSPGGPRRCRLLLALSFASCSGRGRLFRRCLLLPLPAAAALPRSGAGPGEEGWPGRGGAGRARAREGTPGVTAASGPGRSVGTRCQRPAAPRLFTTGGSHAEKGPGDHKGLRDVQAPRGLRNKRKTLPRLKFPHLADTKK